MSTAPQAPTEDANGTVSKSSQILKTCWSCRMLSGGGLILSGAYVFNAARGRLHRAGLASIGTVAQITFAACIASWGIVIIADPVDKSHRVDEKPA